MKTLVLFSFLALLTTACSHPLEIEGEGDILSSDGRYTCLLEEQPCENVISGDYVVTYSAVPREGWQFDGWDGCANQYPDCVFDIPADTVNRFWGQVMPPLRANFSRIMPRSQVLIIFDNSGSMKLGAIFEATLKSRIEVAQETVNAVINNNTSVDFGLATFNHNSDGSFMGWECDRTMCDIVYNREGDNGGRIIKHLKPNMTAEDREALAGAEGVINSLVATGSTPLAESTYEVYRYLAGLEPFFGLKEDSLGWDFNAGQDGVFDTPSYDRQAINSQNKYNSPIDACTPTHVILLTDGFPSLDTAANTKIESDFDVVCGDYEADGGGTEKSCLAEITKYMANNDLDGDSSNGEQSATFHAIGFATDQQLLQEAASNGNGLYFSVDRSDELLAAFNEIILSISNTTPVDCPWSS